MADVDKIVHEAEHRHNLKEWHKTNGLQLKGIFSYVALTLLLGFSPLIVTAIMKVAN